MTTVSTLRWWHLDAVHALEQSLFPSDAWSLEQFWSELAQPTRRYLVAFEGDEVVGYAGLFLSPPDADVQTIAVRGDQQGRGVGRVLLTDLLSLADDGGATHTLLEVRADNAPALALYEAAGFVRISQRPRYYADGSDALILRRTRPGYGEAGHGR